MLSDKLWSSKLFETLAALELRFTMVIHVFLECTVLLEDILALWTPERLALLFSMISLMNLEMMDIVEGFATRLADMSLFSLWHVVDLVVSLQVTFQGVGFRALITLERLFIIVSSHVKD